MDYELALAEARKISELKERVEVVITTTMMLVLSMPHIPHIQIKESELREPFDILFGDEGLGLYPLADNIWLLTFLCY